LANPAHRVAEAEAEEAMAMHVAELAEMPLRCLREVCIRPDDEARLIASAPVPTEASRRATMTCETKGNH
jgi:hypothetical protein